MKKNNICFVAGHSGGHIIPCLTKAQELKETDSDCAITMITTNSMLDQKIVRSSSIVDTHITLSVENIPYHNLWRLPLFAFRFFTAFMHSIYHFIKRRPSVVISMGGFISIPVCAAASLLRIPIELYELNVEPGKTTALLAPFAKTIWVTYGASKKYFATHKCKQTNYPVRFGNTEKQIAKDAALKKIGFSPTKKTVFIIGGSQGSLFLNTILKKWIETHPDSHHTIQIIHQTGDNLIFDWQAWYGSYNIQALTFSYHHELATLYQAADIIITRAGAGTLAELEFFRKKSIIIPLEIPSTSHQIHNAIELEKKEPTLFTLIRQNSIEKNNASFFDVLNSSIDYQEPK